MWKMRNPDSKHNLNENTMGTQRRYILKNNKFSKAEIEQIQREVKDIINPHGTATTLNHDMALNPSLKVPNNKDQAQQCMTHVVKNDKYGQHPETPDEPDQSQKQKMAEFKEYVLDRVKEDVNTEDEMIREPLKKFNNNQKAKELIKLGNEVIAEILQQKTNLLSMTEINKLIYAVAVSIQERIKPNTQMKKKNNDIGDPPWKIRIQRKIINLRRELSQLKECKKSALSTEMQQIKDTLFKKYNIKKEKQYQVTIEKLKQLISAKACRIKRYVERSQQYQQNKLFSENTSKFYNNILGMQKKIIQVPPKEEVENFWKKIWGRNNAHNDTAGWIQEEYEKNKQTKVMEWEDINITELKSVLNSTSNWKAPGMDGIPNFWLKHLTSIHPNLVNAYNDMMNENMSIPAWLTKGKTYLIPKNEKTETAQNYRPITCLNNIYKVLTKIMSERLHSHLINNDLFPYEQRGCRKNTYGCKDHLLTSKALHQDCKENRKSMSLAWIDYSKAFDSIPHSWLAETLRIYKASPILQTFISKTMTTWRTDLHLMAGENSMKIEDIQIRNGIYQGDSLSPLLFCIALFPLSSILDRTATGYRLKNESQKINHLLYVDDLKLIAKNDEELENQIKIVKQFSDDIRMNFGLEKCAKATFRNGKLQSSLNIEIDKETTIQALDQQKAYKYLGIEEHDGIQNCQMKLKLTKEYYRRIRRILRTELNARNKITAITTLAVPVIQYSFGIIKWTLAEIRKLDRQTRKMLTMHGALHPKADVDRLYIPRKDGGRGMQHIENSYSMTIDLINNYLKLKHSEKYLGMVYRQLRDQLEKNSMKNKEEKEIESSRDREPEIKSVKKIKEKIKETKKNEQMMKWREKPLHGQIVKEVEKETINKKQSWKWLMTANLKSETEALITACQEQAIATKYMVARIMKSGNDPKCRLCRTYDETIHHIVAGCPILAKKAYLDRHNKVAAILHWNMCKEFDIKTTDKWYLHNPDPVANAPHITIIWDTQVQTDRKITANKPDIILKDEANKTCLIIDVAIPSDYNVTQKEAEKYLKYKDLQIEIQRMWNMRAKIIPVVIGATGLISNSTCKAIEEIPGSHNLLMLQKTVVLSTAHIVRKVL